MMKMSLYRKAKKDIVATWVPALNASTAQGSVELRAESGKLAHRVRVITTPGVKLMWKSQLKVLGWVLE
tara:strand:- start:172 stop:378 length:207 start_codon:yes stop_codon:yes gene_type:complete